MSDIRYTKEHEYVSLDGAAATIGISDYAQEQLGDVVFVDLPEVGTIFEKGDEAAVVESVKAASEIYSPASGKVIEVNGELEDEPALVNTDPMGRGWFIKISLNDVYELDELMDEAAYAAYIAEL